MRFSIALFLFCSLPSPSLLLNIVAGGRLTPMQEAWLVPFRFGEQRLGYISTLGVEKPFRKRGLGKSKSSAVESYGCFWTISIDLAVVALTLPMTIRVLLRKRLFLVLELLYLALYICVVLRDTLIIAKQRRRHGRLWATLTDCRTAAYLVRQLEIEFERDASIEAVYLHVASYNTSALKFYVCVPAY